MSKVKPSKTDKKKETLRFGNLGVSVTVPAPGPQNCPSPFYAYGTWNPAIASPAAQVIGPNNTVFNGVQVIPPTQGDWYFNFPGFVPQANTQYSFVIADSNNPGTAVIVAFSCAGPQIALGGIVTNQPIVTLTGTTTATLPLTALGATFVVEQPTATTFAVTSHVPAGFTSATLQLMTKDGNGKQVRFPAIAFSVLTTAPSASASPDPSGNNLIDVIYSNPMADSAFAAANYSLQDSTNTAVPIAAVIELDGQTAQIQTQKPLASDTYTLTIGSVATAVTDQAGNAYDYTVTQPVVVP